MALLTFGEVFGYPTDDKSGEAMKARQNKPCPFCGGPCTKVSISDPLGICSLAEGNALTTICPYRFTENDNLVCDAAKLAFGGEIHVVVASEIRILKIEGKRNKKIGKVDYIIAKEGDDGTLEDFAAIEVQSVYVSGYSMRDPFDEFLQTGSLPDSARRRPDFRSSAQKRLMPQLSLKVPVFRRWGKKFFVAVDRSFYRSLPKFRQTESFTNSEITWLVYPFDRHKAGQRYKMGAPEIVFSEWDEVQSALREGVPPEPEEILDDIAKRKDTRRLFIR